MFSIISLHFLRYFLKFSSNFIFNFLQNFFRCSNIFSILRKSISRNFYNFFTEISTPYHEKVYNIISQYFLKFSPKFPLNFPFNFLQNFLKFPIVFPKFCKSFFRNFYFFLNSTLFQEDVHKCSLIFSKIYLNFLRKILQIFPKNFFTFSHSF